MFKYLVGLTIAMVFLACGGGNINPVSHQPEQAQAQKQASPETATGQPKLELAFDLNRYDDFRRPARPYISFDRVFAGVTFTRTARISNAGDEVLTVNISGLNGVFTATPDGSISIDPGASAEVAIRFTPVSEGYFQQDITVTSNDPSRTTQGIRLFGSAIRRPPQFTEVTSSIIGSTAPVGQPINFTAKAERADKVIWSVKDWTIDEFVFVPMGEGETFAFTPEHGGAFEIRAEASAGIYGSDRINWVIMAIQ